MHANWSAAVLCHAQQAACVANDVLVAPSRMQIGVLLCCATLNKLLV
jgi:hypothetical protein